MVNEINDRLYGLDLARFAALIGMVFVNFDVAMVPSEAQHNASLATLLQGRAAATFVVLAGIGLGLSSRRPSDQSAVIRHLKRAAFLFALGMLNCLIFQPDIIHYYAVYFVLALVFFKAPSWLLSTTIACLALTSLVLLIVLEYDRGWDWDSLTYLDFWTASGFLRNLLFNGWHPVIPWFAFVLFGLLLCRLDLTSGRVAATLTLAGAMVLVATEWVSNVLLHVVAHADLTAAEREISYLLDTLPVPPAPLYLVAGMSAASMIIGACLLCVRAAPQDAVLKALTETGRHTLTLYIAHIIIGMGTLQALGLIGNATPAMASLAAIIFCSFAIAFSVLWSRRFRRGPLELLMNRLTR